jgi:hypothetical protein
MVSPRFDQTFIRLEDYLHASERNKLSPFVCATIQASDHATADTRVIIAAEVLASLAPEANRTVLLNSTHVDCQRINFGEPVPFDFDARMLRSYGPDHRSFPEPAENASYSISKISFCARFRIDQERRFRLSVCGPRFSNTCGVIDIDGDNKS